MMIAGNASHVHGFTDPAQMVWTSQLHQSIFQARDSVDDDRPAVLGTTAICFERVGIRRGPRLAARSASPRSAGLHVVYLLSEAAAGLVLIPGAPATDHPWWRCWRG
jgi:hypothetical protein